MSSHEPHHYRPGFSEFFRVGLIVFAIFGDWFKFWGLLPDPEFFSLVVTLIGSYPILKEAFSNLMARRMTMELSMAIAIVAALTIEEHLTALVIAFFVLAAEMLERMTLDRGRQAIKNLLDFLPHEVSVKQNGDLKIRDTHELKSGEVIVVKPGERIAVDGFVIHGHSFVDQSAITGESLPVEKIEGKQVYAGTINQSGVLEIRTDRLGKDTAFGRIIETIEKAEKSRAPIQKTADRLAGYLVYFAFACAALTFAFTHNARDTISVIIVAGACGIAAGTPLAIVGAVGQAARHGAVIKGGLYLEILAKIDTVVLDKTGTLTFGAPELTRIIPAPGVTEKEVLAAAMTAERFSEHPFAKAVMQKAGQNKIIFREPDHFEAIPGRGIVCTLNGEEILVGKKILLQEKNIDLGPLIQVSVPGADVLVARSGKLMGALHFTDVIRPEAAQAVGALKQMKIRSILLSGDTMEIARAVGRTIGVDAVDAELLPEEKVERVKVLLSQKGKVAMIGDGVNDAPALAQASVGVAMGSGTDVARESADILLIGNDLLKFVDTVQLARRAMAVINFNFIGTLVVDTIGVGLAAFGFLNPMLAAFIHVFSELVFILNSARLLPYPAKKISSS